jgi:hypothetical protein
MVPAWVGPDLVCNQIAQLGDFDHLVCVFNQAVILGCFVVHSRSKEKLFSCEKLDIAFELMPQIE